MNTGQDHCRELAESIQKIFAAGFRADATTTDFINSVLGYPNHQELQAVLNDAGNCDREGLIDLIVSPDDDRCCEMEAFLERASFAEQDIHTVFSLLPEDMSTSLRVTGLRPTVTFSVPASCRYRYLMQLRVTRQIDPDIRGAINKYLPGRPDRLRALAGIRHSRLVLTAASKEFLLLFISRAVQEDRAQWLHYLDFMLDLLNRQKADQDVSQVLATEKQNCLKQVDNNRRLSEKLTGNNMETLMLQGSRLDLSADIPSLLRKMETIDKIFRLVWGRVPVVDTTGSENPEAISFLFEKDLCR